MRCKLILQKGISAKLSILRLRSLCDGKNEYYGAIGIYYENQAIGHRRYPYRAFNGIDTFLLEKVFRFVIQNSNTQLVDTLYTWSGVNNALLRDRLLCQKEERTMVENERRKALYELLELKENLDFYKYHAYTVTLSWNSINNMN